MCFQKTQQSITLYIATVFLRKLFYSILFLVEPKDKRKIIPAITMSSNEDSDNQNVGYVPPVKIETNDVHRVAKRGLSVANAAEEEARRMAREAREIGMNMTNNEESDDDDDDRNNNVDAGPVGMEEEAEDARLRMMQQEVVSPTSDRLERYRRKRRRQQKKMIRRVVILFMLVLIGVIVILYRRQSNPKTNHQLEEAKPNVVDPDEEEDDEEYEYEYIEEDEEVDVEVEHSEF